MTGSSVAARTCSRGRRPQIVLRTGWYRAPVVAPAKINRDGFDLLEARENARFVAERPSR